MRRKHGKASKGPDAAGRRHRPSFGSGPSIGPCTQAPGARRLLAEKRIGPIQLEFIPACLAMRVSMRDFFEALPGYDLHRLMVDGSLLPMTRYDTKRHEVFVIHNVVATRRDA